MMIIYDFMLTAFLFGSRRNLTRGLPFCLSQIWRREAGEKRQSGKTNTMMSWFTMRQPDHQLTTSNARHVNFTARPLERIQLCAELCQPAPERNVERRAAPASCNHRVGPKGCLRPASLMTFLCFPRRPLQGQWAMWFATAARGFYLFSPLFAFYYFFFRPRRRGEPLQPQRERSAPHWIREEDKN